MEGPLKLRATKGLRSLRGSHGKTAAEVASDIGLSRSKVTAMENGQGRVTLTYVDRWAAALRHTPHLVLLPEGKDYRIVVVRSEAEQVAAKLDRLRGRKLYLAIRFVDVLLKTDEREASLIESLLERVDSLVNRESGTSVGLFDQALDPPQSVHGAFELKQLLLNRNGKLK